MASNVAVTPVPDKDVEQNTSNVQPKDTSNVQAFLRKHSSAVTVTIWLLSVMAVASDPFFFYIPVVKNASTCLGFDNNLRIVIVVLRSFVDVLHSILWWYHSWPLLKKRYEGPKSRKHLIIRARTVAILAILPLPQVVIFAGSWQLLTIKLLKFIVLIQFFIRLCRIIPAYKDATRSSYMLPTYTWFAAAIYFILYTIASNVFGAYWYLRAVERNMDCWKGACHKNWTLCVGSSLYCDHTSRYNGFLRKHCSILQASSTESFDYGIYDEAFQTIIIKTNIHFLDKFFRCFWWGLRNMSSLGQNLKTSTHTWDTFFAVVIATCGLVLFAFFIGNLQTYLQTKTPADMEKMELRRRHLEDWNPYDGLSEYLKREVTLCEDPRWQEITEVNLESLLHNIPAELRKDVQSYLCKYMFEKVPEFTQLYREELCNRAKPVVYPERSYILREGDLITETILILHGDLISYTERDKNKVDIQFHRASKDNYLFFGRELIQHLSPSQKDATVTYTSGLFIAERTIKALTKVEAFVISIQEICSVFDEYQGKLHGPDNLYGSRGII